MASLKRRSMNPPLPQIAEEDTTEPFRRDIDLALGTDASREPRNAFAEEGLRVHRHRLASNAFYQEAYAQRKNTPPTMVHPAFRYTTNIYDISQALPELNSAMAPSRPSLEMQEVSPRRAHTSCGTTMSPFINAGIEERIPSPPLKLMPSPKTTHPTLRNAYDEHNTDAGQQEGSHGDDFITVTRYLPKANTQDFGHHSQQFEPSEGKNIPASPKRSLLDRFRVPNRRGAVPLQPLPSIATSQGAPKMPAKARAVLVAMPSSHPLSRSPSKTKGFWSRRKPSVNENAGKQTHIPALKMPPHSANPALGRNELPGYSRSHSLGYVDHSVPPTPPSKDTPPEEKARHEAAGASVAPFVDSTPTRKKGFLSLTDRLSPNKSGGYGKRSNPTLVTQASTHSLRASVVPFTMDGQDFNETRARIEGLGVEGFCVSDQNRQKTFAYSPSMYSPDMGGESMGTFPTVTEHKHKKSKSSSDTGISDMGDISIIYPELARDPSITSFMTPSRAEPNTDDIGALDRTYSDLLRQERMPLVRRDGIDIVIHEVDDMLRGGEPSPSNSSLFAIPVSHASAQVSPLHFQPAIFSQKEQQQTIPDLQPVIVNSAGYQILPATTYNPWDVQQQSNHSPSRELHLSKMGALQATVTNKKNTAATPGLEYDSGVDVDPKKLPVKQYDTSTNLHSLSPSRSSASRKENQAAGTRNPPTDFKHAAQLSSSGIMGRGDNVIKDMIASFPQTEIGKRLSHLEESMKQDATEERRRLEQEVLFDQRIASLEIERFSREPSPTNCYESPVPLSRRASHRKSLSPSHTVSDRKKARHIRSISTAQSSDNHPGTKRISTGEAQNFYRSQLRDSPTRNLGIIDTAAGALKARSSSHSSDTLRPEAAIDPHHVPQPLQDNETIRQLQATVDQQQAWIQAAMARMDAIESKVERKGRDRN